MIENFTPSRPINLYRQPSAKRRPAILDRLDAIQEEVELHEQRRTRDEASANRFRLCIRAICLDLFVAMRADAELCVGIRRDNTGLSKNAAYPDFVSPRPFIAALEGLIAAGYVLQVSLGNEASGQSSRVKATHKLHDKLSFCIESAADIVDVTDPIRLKVGKQGKPKKFLHYEDDTETLRWRANLCRINDNNARYAVKLDITPKVRTALEVTRLAEAQEEARVSREPIQYQRIDINRIRLYRVFNSSDWTEGGRFYGPWWQSVPRAYRRHITINDKLTCEHDFSSLHLRLLYAAVGAPVPNHNDPYSSPYGEAHKSAVKKAFNVMVNAKGRPAQKAVPEFSSSQLNMTWKRFLDGIAEHHKLISKYFYSGEGTRLQRSDADIAERVLLWFADRQYPCLPLHDSFITYATLDDELPGVMEAMASQYLNLTIPTKRTFLATYNGPTGMVTDDIGTLLTQWEMTHGN